LRFSIALIRKINNKKIPDTFYTVQLGSRKKIKKNIYIYNRIFLKNYFHFWLAGSQIWPKSSPLLAISQN
jgi:hypothetical protein